MTSDIRRSKKNAQKVFDFLLFCIFEIYATKYFLRNPLAAFFESREEEEEMIITWNRSNVIYLMMRVKNLRIAVVLVLNKLFQIHSKR